MYVNFSSKYPTDHFYSLLKLPRLGYEPKHKILSMTIIALASLALQSAKKLFQKENKRVILALSGADVLEALVLITHIGAF